MINLLKRVVAVVTLSAGILGIITGFTLCVYPVDPASPRYALAVSAIAGGILLWWMGCRVSSGALRQDCYGPVVAQTSEQVGEQMDDVVLPLVVALKTGYPDLAEPLRERYS